ncbi:FAD-dependent oxidoreductase [Gloeobacter kilaueensis]|uniref:2-octaprenyl-6-methoxyphenyl hydroxylase n=1 Tax=Gloeobacter kilaueensis (strain ATCC BAA-2537 / CCAP 1431/1 / ULC 316 / JS1) TaxID=1183438 RepID=U5QPH9_GLOK1|nr:2-octaprenyl-6-methoxyphenyl hydroxylase [Gloeobacter kilaueensis]AGY59595.1 2-octaprenyl-6-methoxyphenyl hydroxylase [Gloeobacter kilaueensis JS1]
MPASRTPLSPADRENLRRAQQIWEQIKAPGPLPVAQVLSRSSELLFSPQWDVAIAGGTLGAMIAVPLARRGWRVALVERGHLRGRDQEWNVSRPDLDVLVERQLLSRHQLEQAIATHCGPARIQFMGGEPITVQGVLDVGVDPVFLLATLKERFLEAGGTLIEQAAFESAVVHPDGVSVRAGGRTLTARLLVDAMGHFSPIVRQARGGVKPDGVCLVVGSCARGYAASSDRTDLIVSFTPSQNQCQYFWEAFPARDGRTTYLFTYVDADPRRFDLEVLLDEYLHLLPVYQGANLEDLRFERLLFGVFPSYRRPLDLSRWDRVLAVGDSAGNQSPLSFGGFGAMLRHLGRLETGIDGALRADCLGGPDLQRLQPYQPNLAASWLFQKAMSIAVERRADPDQINRLLTTVFAQMQQLGEPVLKPFLQDIVQAGALTATLVRVAIADPALVVRLLQQLGAGPVLEWTGHYTALLAYSGLFQLTAHLDRQLLDRLPAPLCYRLGCLLEAWRYGSGND